MTRIAPTIQQSGTQTIQQSIYLTHGSPCGLNPLLFNKIGSTGLTYQTFADLLSLGMNHPDSIEAFRNMEVAFIAYNLDSTNTNKKLAFLNSQFQYARTVWESGFGSGNVIQLDGYTPILTLYDGNGTIVFDSSIFPYWNPATEISPGVFSYTQVKLLNPNPSNSPTCSFYELIGKPTCFPFIDANIGNQAALVNSSYLVNQISLGETAMAISSVLTDPANTRVYNLFRFGFSARVNSPGNGNPAYHVCYLQYLKNTLSIGTGSFLLNNLADMLFVRLSLVLS